MSDRSFRTTGIRVGRFLGVELWIHWALIIWYAFILYRIWIGGQGWEALSQTLAWGIAVFATILFHEIGHCVFARYQGGGAEAIVLWPLGGLAHCDAPNLAWNQFWVAAGGPIFQLLPTAIAGLLISIFELEGGFLPSRDASFLQAFLNSYFWYNVFMLGFNVLPIYPLDGGRMFQAILWGRWKSFGRATLATIWVSRGCILATFLAFALTPLGGPQGIWSWPAGCILIWALFHTEGLRQRLLAGEEEDYIFGYDFSRGYTSLERTATRSRPRRRASFLDRLRARARERKAQEEIETRRRVDELLGKITRDGMQSLSRHERAFLERASKKYPRS